MRITDAENVLAMTREKAMQWCSLLIEFDLSQF